jgi:hypothetical protein
MSDLKEAAASRCEHREDALPRKNLIATQGVNKRLALINLWNLCGPLSTGFTAAVISACLIRPEFLAYFSLDTRSNAERKFPAQNPSPRCNVVCVGVPRRILTIRC